MIDPRPGIPDVPDVSAEWYLHVVDAAARLPHAVQVAAAVATEAVLVCYLTAFAVIWWSARTRAAAAMARAVAAPAVTVAAFLVSEGVKQAAAIDRPCRLVPGAVPPISPCPEIGDWSFPSNHATVAGAVTVAVLWSSLRLGLVLLPVAAAAAASRVVVGVHFPHDVVAGFLLGAVVAAALPTIARMADTPIALLRERQVGRLLLGAGAGPDTRAAADLPTRPLRVPRP